MAFDKHMNLVLVDCEEFRPSKKSKKAEHIAAGVVVTPSGMHKRTLGLVILRGENIISFAVEAGPPPGGDAKHRVSAATMMGPGIGRPMARGVPMMMMMAAAATMSTSAVMAPVPGLAGPMRGIGGPSAAPMMPPPGYRPPVTMMPRPG